ncbi:hypothetical protein [Halobaculum rarum]|uniref:hypothetical protein n=1 Tax=Halobaculum rarum TaxID=3075122 RepID=UPI0032AFBC83
MTEDRDRTAATDGGRDGDTIADVDHEPPEGAADPNAVWERGEESPAAETDNDGERR